MKHILLLSLFLLKCVSGFCQNTIGLPDIINYTKGSYKAGAQNRQMRQDDKGIMYFANSEALLTYDGINWKTYPLPNKSIVRCVEFGPDKRLYVGGQDEFGYFSPNETGELTFHSMRNLIPEAERSFTDVWEIYFYENSVFFQTSSKIFQVRDNNCTIFKSTHWRFISSYNNKLIAQDFDKGLLLFKNGLWTPFLEYSDFPADYFVTSLTDIGNDSALITTSKHGVYILNATRLTKLKSSFLEEISKMNIATSAMVNEEHIVIGTNLAGCFIINKSGELIQRFGRKEGLQNNNILDVYLDKEKNLWLGLDNGIDFIAYNNAIKHIYPDYFNEGSGYAVAIHNNNLYLGTSNGLFKTSLESEVDMSYIKADFSPVINTKGQVWNLSEVNGKLLMGHHDGAFEISNEGAQEIDKSTGFWTFLPFSNVLPSSIMIAGTYNGINFYNYTSGKFINRQTPALFESARFVCIDNNTIWVAHPYKGVYRLTVKDDKVISTQIYTADKGLLSSNGNYIFKIKNRIVLATTKGIFEFNNQTNEFELSVFYNKLIGNKNVRYLKEDASGNVWFVFEKTLGLIDMSGTQPQIIYFPELANKFVSGFEFVYPVNANNVFIGGEKGFYHVNLEQYKKLKYPLKVWITAVKAISKQEVLLFGGYNKSVNDTSFYATKKTQIDHSWNSIRFEFAAPVYGQQSTIEYSYLLEGFDKQWSEFSKKTDKEYTNLSAGNYTFKVKSRNNLGVESAFSSYVFVVLPPWYESAWAYLLYTLIVSFATYRLYRHQKKKFKKQQNIHEEEQKRLLYLHQLELEKTEKELVNLRNEKLEAEIKHKNTELASVAMHLAQKGEMLGKIKDHVVKLKKQPDVDPDELKKIIKSISEEDKVDKQWEQFAMHFDTVHSDFLSTLKKQFPALSANELKLSAYLRMNLSTKEIAQLLNISVRGVEISRYRLRKKLAIPKEMNLFEFLLEIKGK